jgi:branched-chain amino acid transport system ATP-binding protein
MKTEGISVLLVEQNARMSLEIADDAFVLDDGIVVYSGSASDLAADEARVRALAGASAEGHMSSDFFDQERLCRRPGSA